MWELETEPGFQGELDWMDRFVPEELGPRRSRQGDEAYERPMRGTWPTAWLPGLQGPALQEYPEHLGALNAKGEVDA